MPTSFLGDVALRAVVEGSVPDGPDVRLVVCWSLEGAEADSIERFERALLAGLTDTHRALTTTAAFTRLLHVVRVSPEPRLGPAFAAAVAAFSKSLAREHARSGATVNAVGVGGRSDDDDERLRTATGYLLSDAAAFVTGQAWGYAGIPLGRPRSAGTHGAGPGTALVSGGAGGIGAAVTRRLHRDGWRLVIGHVRPGPAELLARELDPAGETCRLVSLDLERPDSVGSAVRALEQSGAGLDAAVLVAGWNQTRRFVDTAAEEWSRTLAINLTGPLRLLAALDRHLPRAGRTVVGIGSESARVGDSGRAVYAAAKAGLAAALSILNGATDGLRTATVSAGPVDSPLLHETHGDERAAERGIEQLRRLIPLGRLGRPEEIAEVVALLCSPAGRFLAGEVISVGGGITMA